MSGLGYLVVYFYEYLLTLRIPMAVLRANTVPANRVKILLQTQGWRQNLGIIGALQSILASGFGSFMTGGLFVVLKYYFGLIVPLVVVPYFRQRHMAEAAQRSAKKDDDKSSRRSWRPSLVFYNILSVLLLAPIDTLIARSMGSMPNSEISTWNLITSAFGSAEQFLSLFNGAPITLLMMYIHSKLRSEFIFPLQKSAKVTREEADLFDFILAILTSIIVYPLDTIRQNMMLSTSMDLNLLTLPKDIFMNGGILSFYSGMGVKLFCGFIFSFIESGIRYFNNSGRSMLDYAHYNIFDI